MILDSPGPVVLGIVCLPAVHQQYPQFNVSNLRPESGTENLVLDSRHHRIELRITQYYTRHERRVLKEKQKGRRLLYYCIPSILSEPVSCHFEHCETFLQLFYDLEANGLCNSLDVLNEQSRNEPQGLQSLLGGFQGGGGPDTNAL